MSSAFSESGSFLPMSFEISYHPANCEWGEKEAVIVTDIC